MSLLLNPFHYCIGFTLAAPVLVQEKSQAHVNMVHTPKNVITMLKKHNIYYKNIYYKNCKHDIILQH